MIVARKPYNGFSAEERSRAGRWARAERAAGRKSKPTKCDACGQTEGVIEPHSEDYSAPYGDHIGAFGLCYRCHMMIHCRFSNPVAWHQYLRSIHSGMVYVPFLQRDFQRFAAEMLGNAETVAGQATLFPQQSRQSTIILRRGPARGEGLLDRIDRGEFLNRGKQYDAHG